MSKRVKVLVSVLVAVLMLVASGTAIAMAQEEEEPAPPVESNALLTRVAEILGIPEGDLIGALQQARQEMMEEKWGAAFNQALDRAVEEGLLTPEEADETREWWEQKPEVMDRGLFRQACRFMGPRADCMLGNRLGVHDKMGQQLLPEMNQQSWQGMGQQPWQVIKQRAFQRVNGKW